MTDKDLRRMSRRELLQLLLEMTEEKDRLKTKLDEAEERLRDRSIAVDEAGSIAEAAMRLNGVFDAAQSAAKDYLDNIRVLSERQDRICDKMILEAKGKASAIIEDANAYSKKVRAEADIYYKSIKEKADRLNDRTE